jgi:hypothetical protein
MYKIIYVLSLTVLVSCSEDFLNLSDPTKLNTGNFYRTEEQFNQAMNGVYSQLQSHTGSMWRYAEMMTDNTTHHFNPLDRGQGPALEAIEYWNQTSLTPEVSYNMYSSIYTYLANINTILASLGGAAISDAAKTGIEGQMKFMRAYYYFEMAQYYGDVIIMTEPLSDPDKAWEYQRNPVAEVYSLIDEDLAVAVGALPVTVSSADVGRPTKGAALTLQGRTLMARHRYADAVAAFNQVRQSGVYSLLSDYADVFDPKNKNHAESIMDVQFQGNNDLGEHNGFLNDFYPRESYGAVVPFPNANGGGWNTPTLDIIGDYEDGDLRKEISLKEGYTNNDGVWVAVPYINKYNHPYTIQGRMDDNWPLMRYAEILLSLAEALNEQNGPTDEAYGYLNQVRERAGLPPVATNLTKEAFKTAVLHERRIELAFENHRWYDLRRTMSTDELVAFLNAYGLKERSNPTTADRTTIAYFPGDYQVEAYELLLPIPAKEIRLNPDLRQNEGY